MRFRLVRDLNLPKGHFIRDFDSYAAELATETAPHFGRCLKKTGDLIFPKDSRRIQKQATLEAKMPEGEKARAFLGRLQDVVTKCAEYEPLDVANNELRDVVVRSIPSYMRAKMSEEDFQFE